MNNLYQLLEALLEGERRGDYEECTLLKRRALELLGQMEFELQLPCENLRELVRSRDYDGAQALISQLRALS